MDISKERIKEIIKEEYVKVREQQDTTSVIHDDSGNTGSTEYG